MYWRDRYPTSAHAVKVLKLATTGRVRMSANDLHIAHVAARSGLRGISEDPSNLGRAAYGLTELPHNLSGLKKDIKSALKSTDAAKIEAVMKREQAKIDKAPDSKKAPKRIEYMNQLRAQLSKAQAQTVPTTAVLPGAPAQPIPQLPTPVPAESAMSFSQGGGGGSSPGFAPAPVPGEAATSSSEISTPVMIGIGAAALLVLYLLTRSKK